MKAGDKVTLMDNETKQIYQGIYSSENGISISLTNVKGYGRKLLVFNKSEYSTVD